MMFLPASLAAVASASLLPPSSEEVTYVGGGLATHVDGVSTLTDPVTPAGVQAGDELFALLFARSALTPPTGWTLVESASVSGSGVTQTVYVYLKDSAGPSDSSTSFTWTQAGSDRAALSYLLVRSSSGNIVVAEHAGRSDPGAAAYTAPCPVLTATEDGELFIMVATIITAFTTSMDWYAPSGATRHSALYVDGGRMCVATQARETGESNPSPFTHGLFFADNTAAITVRLRPA